MQEINADTGVVVSTLGNTLAFDGPGSRALHDSTEILYITSNQIGAPCTHMLITYERLMDGYRFGVLSIQAPNAAEN